MLILGDNIFYGDGLPNILQSASRSAKATIFAYKVNDPNRYAVIDYAANGEITDIVEKPRYPTSDLVVLEFISYLITLTPMPKKLLSLSVKS